MSNSDIKPLFIKCNNELDIYLNIINDISKYQVIIDAGTFLRYKNIIDYVNDFLQYKDIVIYFDNQDKAKLINKQRQIQDFNNIELLIGEYLIFYDSNHCRGTDLKLPSCKGLLTINNFNNSVDILQSLYRLRQINSQDLEKIQYIDYYYTNIEQELTIDNIQEYLKNKTIQDKENKNIDFLIQTIKTNNKFIDNDGKYTYNNNEITSFIYPKTKSNLNNIKKDLKNEYIFKLICTKPYNEYCIMLNKLINKNNEKIILSTSTNTNINTNTNTNTNTNMNMNMNMNINLYFEELQITYQYIYNSEKRLLNIDNINNINKIKIDKWYITLYELYLCLTQLNSIL
jgi:hypothetical protein